MKQKKTYAKIMTSSHFDVCEGNGREENGNVRMEPGMVLAVDVIILVVVSMLDRELCGRINYRKEINIFGVCGCG